MTHLRVYWPTLLDEHTEIMDRLIAAYADPGRGYHDLTHLTEVFERIDVLLAAEPPAGIDRDVLLLAAWFHDAVYDSAGDNEERSATLAERELVTADVPPLLVAEVARIVRSTQTHQVTDSDRTGQVLMDADLAILAADESRYRSYVEGVRAEYAAVPDDDFRAGRADVLRALLDFPALYQTSFAKQHWEKPARANIERELSELTEFR